jgi:hypothetical protein
MSTLKDTLLWIEERMQQLGITDEDLEWYDGLTTVLNLTWRDDDPPEWLPEEMRARFLKVRDFLRETPPDITGHATTSDFVYPDCLCGRTLVGLEEAKLLLLDHDGRCFHTDTQLCVLQLVEDRDFGFVADNVPELAGQLIDAGLLVQPRPGALALTPDGQQFLALSRRADAGTTA